MKMNIFKSRRFKHGSLATIITVGFIIGIILVNVVATLLLERFPLSIDLTKDNRFELTQESVDYVKALDSNVTITVCAEEAALDASPDTKQALEILKNYAKYSNKISINFIDLTKNPNFAKEYPGETFAAGDIFIASDMRTKKVGINSLFSQQQTQAGGTIYSSKAEQVLTSALMYATDKNPTTVSLLTGLDNLDATGYKNLLVSNNYNVVEQNILTDEINPDASFVILPQSAADLTAENVKKLDAYLDNDGKFDKSLVFIASPTVEVGPVLKTFLAQWGMEVGAETVMETNQSNAIETYFNVINQVGDEEFGKLLKSQQLPIVTSYAKPIKVLFEASENRKTKILTKTFDSTILFPVKPAEDFDPSKQEQSSFNTMVMGSKMKYEGTTPHTSNVVVVSASSMLSPQFLALPSLSNADATLSMTSLISPKKETVKILPVELNQDQITITQGQVAINMIVFIGIIPLLVLIMGIVVWVRRRHL
ncbi:MAG: Gldg family protein [Oscillospiraceae bacterium]